MRFRWRYRRRQLVLMLGVAIVTLLVLSPPTSTIVHVVLGDRIENFVYFRNMLDAEHRPMLWTHVSDGTLFKIFWGTRVSSSAALAACARPARAFSDVTGPRNPLERLLASEPFGRPKPRPEDIANYSRVWTWIDHSAERRHRLFRFGIKMSPNQKAELLFLWRVVHEALTLHNVSHYLVAGTLLGAFRHGGVIPWDDDVDVAVDGRDADKVARALSCIPGYTLRVHRSLHWKVFRSDAHAMKAYSTATVVDARSLDEAEKGSYVVDWHPDQDVIVRSPYVDLYLMNQDESHTWSFSLVDTRKYVYPLEEVYPLSRASFEGFPAPVPRQSLAILNKIYKPYVCSSHHKDHIYGKKVLPYQKKLTTNCSNLKSIYTMYNVRISTDD